MTSKRYSFLLPAYKALYLEQVLVSIKKQTFTDYKVLVSDDCSPEDLKSIFDKVVGNDSRFTYRRNEENMGSKSLVAHWNLLVDMCDTDFFILASDDDVYAPNFLEEINNLTEKYPNTNLFRGRVQQIDGDNNVTDKEPPIDNYESQFEFLFGLYCRQRIGCIANYVYRTKLLKEKNGFPDFYYAWGSDEASFLLMCEQGCCHTSNVVFSFRVSESNITGSRNLKVHKKKVDAVYQFVLFFDFFSKKLEIPREILCLNRRNRFISAFYKEKLSFLESQACFCDYKSMKKYCLFLKKRGFFKSWIDSIPYIWVWLRSRLFSL
jgi:glycosyltransferase involved in cell wall biosynthesis